MFNEEQIKLPGPECNIIFEEPILKWDEAIPLGNGKMGCLIWGDGFPLRMSLDRGDLWDKRVAKEILEPDYKYSELIKLVKNKDQDAIIKRFDEFYNKPTPTKIPAGAIELNYGSKCSKMSSKLNISTAEGNITLEFDGKASNIDTFLHAKEFYGFIHIYGDAELPEIILKAPEFVPSNDKNEKLEGLKLLNYQAATYGREGEISWFIQQGDNSLEYALLLAQKKISPYETEIAYVVEANLDGEGWLEKAKSKITMAIKMGYTKVILGHEEWWNNFWSKSSITVPEKEYEKLWYINNYLFGACSRKGFPPMPLQGVWTADNGSLPPWKGDYHHDLNTQLSYWHYLKANHIEEGEAFIDFLWDLVPEARNFAKSFFDAPGLCLPSVMSIDGKSLGGWPMYATNLVNQIWLCQAFDHYWQYTGNREFLTNKAYPYFKETAECILRWISEGPDGKLLLPLSSSSEIHDNTLNSWLKPNSNYDLALLMYLFKTLAIMAKELNYDEKEYWNEKLIRLQDLSVNENNVLMISPDESLTESHRHHSHAMAIYPLKLLNYSNKKDKKIIDATVENLELLGSGLWVGYSFAWMAEFYAIQKNGEGAAYQLKLFWDNFCSQNGFHLNGDYKKRGLSSFHYRPFTLEGNMAAADALQEMLLQIDTGVIDVFPAIPKKWGIEGTSFYNFRGYKGVLISSYIKNLKILFISLKAENEGVYKIKNNFGTNNLIIKIDNSEKYILCSQGDIFDICLDKGEKCTIFGSETIKK